MKNNLLSKSDFLQFRNFPESLWLKKNRPDLYPKIEMSEYDIKLSDDGYEVEEIAQKLFSNGIGNIDHDQLLDDKNSNIFFQVSFSDDTIFCRTDILVKLSNGKWNIYEVKSTVVV